MHIISGGGAYLFSESTPFGLHPASSNKSICSLSATNQM
jgi:hypothetical protein